MILDAIARARALGLPHVYLGYWVEGSRKMAYKAAYLPQERLGVNGWVRVERGCGAAPSPLAGRRRRPAQRSTKFSASPPSAAHSHAVFIGAPPSLNRSKTRIIREQPKHHEGARSG